MCWDQTPRIANVLPVTCKRWRPASWGSSPFLHEAPHDSPCFSSIVPTHLGETSSCIAESRALRSPRRLESETRRLERITLSSVNPPPKKLTAEERSREKKRLSNQTAQFIDIAQRGVQLRCVDGGDMLPARLFLDSTISTLQVITRGTTLTLPLVEMTRISRSPSGICLPGQFRDQVVELTYGEDGPLCLLFDDVSAREMAFVSLQILKISLSKLSHPRLAVGVEAPRSKEKTPT